MRHELEAAGAEVAIAACNASDREALRALLGGIPAAHPLTAIFSFRTSAPNKNRPAPYSSNQEVNNAASFTATLPTVASKAQEQLRQKL